MTIRGGGVRKRRKKRRGGALIGADSRTWTPKYLKQGGAWGRMEGFRRQAMLGATARRGRRKQGGAFGPRAWAQHLAARRVGKRGSGMGFSGAGMSFQGGGLRNGRLFLRRGTGRRVI